MGNVSLDTNVIVYAVDPGAGERHAIASDLVRRAGLAGGVLTQQVLGEFLNVSRRSPHLDQRRLRDIGADLCTILTVVPTARDMLFDAYDLAARHRIQFWDAVILTVCRANNVSILFSEDMQDGQRFTDLTILNPFNPANADRMNEVLK